MKPVKPSSPWIEDMTRQLISGSHVLLHGMVNDVSLYTGLATSAAKGEESQAPSAQPLAAQMRAIKIVPAVLQELGYQIIVCANPTGIEVIRSVQFKEGHLELPQDLQKTLAQLDSGDQPYTRATFESLLSLVCQQQIAVALVFDYQDIAMHGAQRGGHEEQADLIRMKRLAVEAELINVPGCLCPLQSVVWVAENLESVCETLYRHDPRVSVVRVAEPNASERLDVIKLQVEAGVASDDDLETLSDLTEGLSRWQLACLPRVAATAGLGFEHPRGIARLAVFGEAKDPWRERDARTFQQALGQLEKAVVGQPAATEQVSRKLQLARSGLTLDNNLRGGGRPRAVFFFAGPTGVGKTELARAIAEAVFGNRDALAVYDMSTYKAENSAERLTGAAPGYVGYSEGGQLTRRVIEHPFSVLLFDEIEKAHKSLFDRFLPILDEGRLTDGRGQTAYFGDCVIIFTSNEGGKGFAEWMARQEAQSPSYEAVCDYFVSEVKRFFRGRLGRPELLGRLGDGIVGFDLLRDEHVREIADRQITLAQKSMLSEHGRELVVEEPVLDRIVSEMSEPENQILGGRQIRELVRQHVLIRAAQLLLDTPQDSGPVVVR